MAGGRRVCTEHNFVILSLNDLKLGMHVHCHIVQYLSQNNQGQVIVQGQM